MRSARMALACLALSGCTLGLSGCIVVPDPVHCKGWHLTWTEPGVWQRGLDSGFEVHQPEGLTPIPLLEHPWAASAALQAVRFHTGDTLGHAAPHVSLEWTAGAVGFAATDLDPSERRLDGAVMLETLSAAPAETRQAWLDGLVRDGHATVTGPFLFDVHFAGAVLSGGAAGFGFRDYDRTDANGDWTYEFQYATARAPTEPVKVSPIDDVIVSDFSESTDLEGLMEGANASFARLGWPPPTFIDHNRLPGFTAC